MKNLLRAITCSLFFVVILAQNAAADLIQDGTFTGVSVTSTGSTTGTLFGQFGPNVAQYPNATASPASKSTLTVAGWSTGGYNFVFAPGTADAGTSSGASTGKPNEAPGQYVTNGYGNTYLWGTNNSGLTAIPSTDPAGGNFLAADGAFEVAAVIQAIYGLTPGTTYAVSFRWAGAQQQSFTGDTKEQWKVNLGTDILTTASTTYQATPFVSVPSHSFSGWMQQTFNFTATSSSETLSFLANGSPSGQPPFVLLGGVTMDVVPEPSACVLFAVLGVACTLFGVVRRRRRLSRLAGESSQ